MSRSPGEGFPARLDASPQQARDLLTARLNVVINKFADRDDLLLFCLWRDREEGEAPAWFDPTAGHVTINARVGLQGAAPREVNPLTRAGRRRHPEIVGLLAHEAAHAHSTAMSGEAQEFRDQVRAEDPVLLEVMTLLEEPRVEYRQVQRRPHDRHYLRAQSVMIDLAPFSVDADVPGLGRWPAASVALLVYGRADAGILTPYDAEHVRPALVDALGEQDFERLREVQSRAVCIEDGDLEGLLGCAREWLEVVGRPDRDMGVEDMLASLFGCSGGDAKPSSEAVAADTCEEDEWALSPGEETAASEADGGEAQDVLSGLGEGLKSLTVEVATEIADDVAAQDAAGAAQAAGQQNAEDRDAEARSQARQEMVAASVFDPDRGGSAPMLLSSRPPTSTERRLAREVGRALKRAQFRDRAITRHTSMAPPGRLNGRDAMLGEAQRSVGGLVTARPFHSKRARHAPEPPITLGVLADYSGSMRWGAKPLASVTWVFAHAMTYVTGTMASALFAEKVVPLNRPGELPSSVQEYEAQGGWENFGRAYDAINGALNLTRGQGVRVLVVLSDGLFVNQNAANARDEALVALRRAGVIVLWVGLPDRTDFPDNATPVPLPPSVRADVSGALVEAITTSVTDALRTLR